LTVDAAVAAAVADAHRREWGFVLAAAARITGDLDVAEECAQEAFTQALAAWSSTGIPAKPGAWLTTVARRRAMDLIRRNDALRTKLSLVDRADAAPPADSALDQADVPDDRLRLVFTCCHPALEPDARVALTLRLLCGLSTGDVARAFLVAEPTMAARITRAKRKIAAARIPYREPTTAELPERLDAVLDVVHLVFTTGHTAPEGNQLQRRDLVERALQLARMLHDLIPGQPGPTGLLALILLTDARRDARMTLDGKLAVLADQDRGRWDRHAIDEGLTLAADAMRRRPPTRYVLMAAIAAVHAQAPAWTDTDWERIAELYDALVQVWPSPVVALNRAIAISHARGPQAGLDALEPLTTEPQLVRYPYLPAARAQMLYRLNRVADARDAYREALLLTANTVERDFLRDRLDNLDRTLEA
jgi:RNA polymerase sigma-70 factor (ECF subfamily)